MRRRQTSPRPRHNAHASAPVLMVPIRGGAEVPDVGPRIGFEIRPRYKPLRVCADPDDLPFSSATTSATSGIYVELGQRIAQRRSTRPV